jgi:hypothetical protein
MEATAAIHAKAVDLTKLAIEMTTAAGSGHPTSAASLAHLVTTLMYSHMRYDPQQPGLTTADRLVLSEGHACPIVYAAAADLGMKIGRTPADQRAMSRADALSLRDIQSEIDGHPNPAEGFPFFAAATGSFGQGLSVAAGLALAAKLGAQPQPHALSLPALSSVVPPILPPRQGVPTFEQALAQFGHGQVIASGQFATRKAYGVALQALGHANSQVDQWRCRSCQS